MDKNESEDKDISNLMQEIYYLKHQLQIKEELLKQMLENKAKPSPKQGREFANGLSTKEIVRYSRQMIIPQIGVDGQNALKKSKVLIVGIGGLGCPAALYLTAAGVGEITIVDYDVVEVSNLHRQVLHSETDTDVPKVQSAYNKLKRLNSDVKIIPLRMHLSSTNMQQLMSENHFTVVVDGSDNMATRYLLNDACILADTPLVSGSALQMEGQLTVYGYRGGPCYRCLFPVPPPAETVTSCGDGGVLGPVPGVIGVLQALEAMKIITGNTEVLTGRLLVFDAMQMIFRNFKLRNKKPDCAICGTNQTITSLIDYEQFCGAKAHDKVLNINILNEDDVVDVHSFCKKLNSSVVIDVRPEAEFNICRLPSCVNIPYSDIKSGRGLEKVDNLLKKGQGDFLEVFVLCRRGNDSQRAIVYLKKAFKDKNVKFLNVIGGLHSYATKIDSSFPIY